MPLSTTKKVLLIDDDPEEHELFEMALEDLGLWVEHYRFFSCIESIGELSGKTYIPDFIFLDLNIPLMNGLECLRELRKIEHLSKASIIIYTASSSENEAEEARKLGVDHFLTKPAKVEELVSIFESIFRKKELPFRIKPGPDL